MIPDYQNPNSSEISSRPIFMSTEQEMRLQECPQCIPLIWPTGPVYDPRWPKFKLVCDFIKTNSLINFQVNWATNMASRAPKGISLIWHTDLVYDPGTQIRTHQDFIKVNIVTSFQVNWATNVASKEPTRYSCMRPSDQVYDPRWPKLELIRDFIETNILTNF